MSDSHKKYEILESIVNKNQDSDMFIHLGDGMFEVYDIINNHPNLNFAFVRGNCDYGESPAERIIETPGGVRIFCTHGHLYSVNSGVDNLIAKAKSENCSVALYGHTHIYCTEVVNGIYLMNPGSVTSPRGKNPPTYGIITISDNMEIDMSVLEAE
jgi:putative phosphoesterase